MTTRQSTSGSSDTRKRRGGGVVPVPTGSSTCDGPPEELPTRSSGEAASVRGESDGSGDSVRSAISVCSLGNEEVRTDRWIPKLLPRHSELLNGKVSRREYYDQAWHMEMKLEEWGEKDKIRMERHEVLEGKIGKMLKKSEEIEKNYEVAMKAAVDWEAYACELEDEVKKAKARTKEIEKGRGSHRKSVHTQTGAPVEVSLTETHAQTDPPVEMSNMDVQTDAMVGVSAFELQSQTEASPEGGFGGRFATLEREVARMVEAVALLAQAVSLQGDRLAGEMTTIRSCAHAQWLMGGGLPLTSGDEAGASHQTTASSGEGEEGEIGAPRTSLPTAVCGAPKGGRSAGGGGGGASKKRRRVVGEKTGVSPPTQLRRIGSGPNSEAAGGCSPAADVYCTPVG